MKKLFCIVCFLLMFAISFSSNATAESVEDIDNSREVVQLSNGVDVEIEDFAIVNAYLFTTPDIIYVHKSGYKPDYTRDLIDSLGNNGRLGFASGEDSELATLYVDITNLCTVPKNFLEDAEVMLVFRDKYYYGGVAYQYNPYIENHFFEEPANEIALHPDDVFEIEPLYTGHYSFVCKIPNMIVDRIGDEGNPMKMEIVLGNHKLEYCINE